MFQVCDTDTLADVTLFQRSSTYVISVDKGVSNIVPRKSHLLDPTATLVTVLAEAVWENGAPTEDIDIKADQSIPWSFQKLLARRDEPNVLETDKYVF